MINSDVSVTFIYTIVTTSFEYGILLNASEEMFHRFYQKVVLNDRVKPAMQDPQCKVKLSYSNNQDTRITYSD